MPSATKLERQERRARIKELYARGTTSPARLAKMLDVNRKTIYNDLEAIREEKLDEKMSSGEVLMPVLLRMEAVNRELWDLLDASEQDSVKLGVLNAIRRNNSDYLDILTSLGIVDRQALKISKHPLMSSEEEMKIMFESV